MASIWGELKRRNVVKVAVTYAIVAWLLVEIASTLLPTFEAPQWVVQTIILIILLGFPLAVIFAWAFELTPEGLKKTEDVHPEKSITHKTGQKINYMIIGVLAVALAIAVGLNFIDVDRSVVEPGTADETGTVEAGENPPLITDRPSIAVLPFTNMSDDIEQGFIADGLTEDLITALAQQNSLFVIARSSSFAYEGQFPDIRQVGRELGVRYVVEGSVRRVGERIRVTAQLIEAETGKHEWAESYDRPWAEFFEIESELAGGLARALGTELSRVEGARALQADVETLDAWGLNQRAWKIVSGANNMLEGIPEGLVLWRRALALDPDPALAARIHTSIVLTTATLVEVNWSEDPEADEALAWSHARKALALGPGDPEVLTGWGTVQNIFGDPQEAVAVLQRALELNPVHSGALTILPQALLRVGRPRDAIQLIEKQMRLDPKRPLIWINELFLSIAHLQLEQYEEAEGAARRAIWGNESSPLLWFNLAVVLAAQSRVDESTEAAVNAHKAGPDYTLANFEQFYVRFFPDEGQAKQVMDWVSQAWIEE